jgi:hypothetical protein
MYKKVNHLAPPVFAVLKDESALEATGSGRQSEIVNRFFTVSMSPWKSWLNRLLHVMAGWWQHYVSLGWALGANLSKHTASLLDWIPDSFRLSAWFKSRRKSHSPAKHYPSYRLPGRRLTRSGARELAADLRGQKTLLLTFTTQLEAEFLKLGKALQAMDQEAIFIEQKYDRIYAITSGQNGDSPLQRSFELLKKAEDLVYTGYHQYEHVFQVFKELASKMNAAIHLQNQLQRDLSLLPPIVVQFRVQASEFAEAVREPYFSLADEMNGLLDQIRTAVEQQFISLWRSRGACTSLAEDLAANIAKYRVEIQKTLDISRNHLQTLSRAMADSSLTVRDLSQHSQSVSTEINRVIMALQCQDITRQKVEHVTQAADEIAGRLEQATHQRMKPPQAAELRQFIGEAAAIQWRQIKAVFQDNENAAHQIAGGMRGLQGVVERLAEGAVRTGHLALDSGIIQQSIESMRDMMVMVRVTSQKTDEIRSAIAPLQVTFDATTAKISILAQGVRRGALNAQIQAARVEGGAVLEVLAEQTRLVSDITLRTVEKLGSRMDAMSSLIAQLQTELLEYQTAAAAKQRLLAEEAIPCEANLLAMRHELPEHIDPIGTRQKTLSAMIAQGISDNRFPEAVANTQSASLPFWEALSSWASLPGQAAANSSEVSQQLDRLKSNYTMANERELHEKIVKVLPAPAVMAAATRTPGAQPAPLPPAGELAPPVPDATPAPENAPSSSETPVEKKKEDLGDNIELF